MADPTLEIPVLHPTPDALVDAVAACADLGRVVATADADTALMAVAGVRLPILLSAWVPDRWPGFDAQLEQLAPDALRLGIVTAETAADLDGSRVAGQLVGVVTEPVAPAALRLALRSALAVRARALEAAERFTAAEREFESFVYAVSHDLKAPLQGVLGVAGLLVENHAAELSAKAMERCQRIEGDAERMGEMIQALSLYSRLGRGGLRTERVRLGELVDEVFGAAIGRHARRIPRLTMDDALPMVVADRALVETVVNELVENALRFNDAAPPRVHVTWADAGDGRRGGTLTVTDNGIGVPAQVREQVFEMFERHHRDRSQGVGSGLAFVRRAAMLHGGRAWAEAGPEGGTVVHVTLPVPVVRG